MTILAYILIMIVAIEHLYILALEMFFSTSKAARRTFGVTEEFIANKQVQSLFANQGLYNGFLAAGLIWGLLIVPSAFQFSAVVFFLSCVIIAAVYGGLTANKGILIKQGSPAILALIVTLIALG
ncbi:DUF1304 domain-containing protein [Brochothrix thermosphacta]|uniref:DUF1304 domain-containing protein n=1 Tax=Brochothrix thermosphacta TaxID=2756 RepID=UPI003F9A48B3